MGNLADYLGDILEFKIGDIVYLKTDPEQLERIVFSYTVNKNEVVYNIAQGSNPSSHYEFEMSADKIL